MSAGAQQFRSERDLQTRLLPSIKQSVPSGILYTHVQTFAMDEELRACLLLDLDRSGDPRLEGGSNRELSPGGRFVKGNKLAPGLADRDMRGQAIPPVLQSRTSSN
jgi:hypothetical protein